MGFSNDYLDIAWNHESTPSATQHHQMLQVGQQAKEEAHLDLLHLVIPRDLSHTVVRHKPVGKEQVPNPCREVF